MVNGTANPSRMPQKPWLVDIKVDRLGERWYKVGIRPALRAWERLYNTFRPDQALAGLTPAEYLVKRHPELAPT